MMSKMSKREYLIELKKEYFKASKKRKTQLVSDFCAFTGLHRKSALRLINSSLKPLWKRNRVRNKIYDKPVIDALLKLWEATNGICAERLHPFIPALLEKLVSCNEIIITKGVKKKLLRISLGTVKKALAKEKRRTFVKLRGTTKPGSILKRQIAIRFGLWGETDPGWCETDTVAHSGADYAGDFIFSLNLIDICSGWSEQAAIWGKGEAATTLALNNLRERLPFPLLGLDPDNGSEFINWQLFRYCKKNNITLTRSRPYHKNDNAHVEQKNYTAIRQLLGWERLDKRIQLNILNDLYANCWRLYLNFFQPTMKLEEKIKDTLTGKSKKKYCKAKTPYQRLMKHPKISNEQKEVLKSIYDTLNPIQLQRNIHHKLELLKKTLK